MRSKWTWGAPFALTLAIAIAASCSSGVPDFGPPGTCDPSQGPCPNTTSAGAGVGATTTGVGGGVGTSTGVGAGTPVSGLVDLITEPDFIDTAMAQYHGTATIAAYPPAGGTVSTNYGSVTGTGGGSTAGSSFTFAGLPSGLTWFLVSPTMVASATPTLSSASLPIPGAFTLPVVDPTVLQGVATDLADTATQGVSPTAAQIVVRITKAGVPYPGVSNTGTTGGAIVAYDTGDGFYSDTTMATGSAGTIILFNSGLLGKQLLTFTDTSMTSESVEILAGQGAVTLATLDWQ